MYKEDEELTRKLASILRPRIRMLAENLSAYEELAANDPYLLLSTYLIYDSSERLNELTDRLNRLILILIALTALNIIVAFKDLFHW
jgi:hypothetical protein